MSDNHVRELNNQHTEALTEFIGTCDFVIKHVKLVITDIDDDERDDFDHELEFIEPEELEKTMILETIKSNKRKLEEIDEKIKKRQSVPRSIDLRTLKYKGLKWDQMSGAHKGKCNECDKEKESKWWCQPETEKFTCDECICKLKESIILADIVEGWMQMKHLGSGHLPSYKCDYCEKTTTKTHWRHEHNRKYTWCCQTCVDLFVANKIPIVFPSKSIKEIFYL